MNNDQETQDLLKVYAIERQDDSTALVLGFSMVTAAFTYMIAAFIFVDGHHAATICLLAPLAPTAVAGFLTLNTAATLIRSVLLQRIEMLLRPSVPYASFHTEAGIVWRPERIEVKNISRLLRFPVIQLAFTAITFAVY